MSESLDSRLSEVFHAVFDLPHDADVGAIRQVTTAKWDSLGHVSLVTALESEFGIEISAVDSIDITSFEAARLVISELMSTNQQ